MTAPDPGPLSTTAPAASSGPTPPRPEDADRPSRHAWLVAVSAGLGYLFDSYVVNIYSFVLPLIAVSFALSSAAQGLIGSILLAGYTLGTFGFGLAADRFGRRDTLGASILLYGVTTAASGLAGSVGVFAALRFVTGLGGAGELSVGVPYALEEWPRRRRAIGAGAVIFSLFAVGALVAIGISLVFAPWLGWRAAFLLSLLPALGVFVLRRAIRESDPFQRSRETSGVRRARIRRITGDPVLRRRLIVGGLIFIANAVGYWGYLVFLQKYLISEFGLSFRQSLGLTAVFYLAMAIWPVAGSALAERIGRRPTGVLGAVVLAGTSVLAFSTHSLAVFVTAEVFGIGLLGWTWAVANTYVAELFPTGLRATGFGLSVAIGRLPSIAGPVLTGALIGTAGLAPVARWFALVWLLYVIGFLLGPETRGRTLTELDQLDQPPTHTA